MSCWGRKKLAWQRLKCHKGTFVQHTYVGKPGIAHAYDRLLAMDERVLLRQSVLLKAEGGSGTVWPDHTKSHGGEREGEGAREGARASCKPHRQEQPPASDGDEKSAAAAGESSR